METYTSQPKHEQRRLLLQRLGALQTERSSWMTHWQDITRHLLPRSGKYFSGDASGGTYASVGSGTRLSTSGRYKYNSIYDNTGTRALRVLGAGMMAGATSPARPWFRLVSPDPELNDYHSVRVWTDDVVRRMQRVFARSNTYRTLHTIYEELGAFGTSVSVVLPDFANVIHHYPVPVGEFYIDQDYQGRICTLYREFEKTVAEVVKEFGLDKVSHRVRNLYEKGNLQALVRLIHVIEPREDRDPSKLDGVNKAWKSCYIEQGGEDDAGFLRESGFDRFPVLAPRWAVQSCDVYGHSPGMEALGDIRQLQQEQLRKGQAIDYQTKPPLQVPAELANRDREMMPGGINWWEPGGIAGVNQQTPHGGIRTAFEVNLNLDHLLLDIQDVRARINGAFYADLFLMLANAGPDQRMTATEVAERHEEKLLMLGPVLERLHNELLEPLVEMTFDRMMAVGALPPPPPEIEGMDLGVEFVSILAQAQRAIGSNSVDRFVSSMLTVAQHPAKQDVLDKFNADKWADIYSDQLGVDPRIIVSDDDVAALRDARNKAVAAQEQAAMMEQQASAAQKLAAAKTSEPSALTELTGYATEDVL